MTINRRSVLAGTAALTAGAGLALSGRPASAAETLTGVTYLPPSYADLAYGSQGFVDYVNDNHADAVAIDFYDSARLLSADEQLPALRSGTIDFMFHTTSYITRSLPILGITGLPGVVGPLYENPERIAIGSPLFELVNSELNKQGLTCLSFGGGIMEPEYIWSAGDPGIRSLDDIDGKKIRVVSFEATKAIEDFGGAAVRIPSSELYLALQRGTVDAAVANISTINGRSIQEQVRQVLQIPVTAYAIGIFVQTDRFEAMPEEIRSAMLDGAQWFDEHSAKQANVEYYENQYWPKFREGGLDVVDPDQDALDRFAEVSANVRTAWTKEVGEEIGQQAIALAMGETA
ncbi:TRAP-type C4-dicarboxylate transport system substrate-binding protein [Palleronia aestuarii]|uniref:TRAP-type C4-dicarboxylate transport system substrate-binding protein n=1 Tax=Palleronia aestuarii TaxID=568105 RepID=A0A2W7NGU0_9RHOB|nr:TRAP transporter substrate-binding protein DctP [Palleronia aestuarii]PZX12356.1 TRAP-type C4-dicarboxylate transport system substrate-binding protein [Palleronia aestuarii]